MGDGGLGYFYDETRTTSKKGSGSSIIAIAIYTARGQSESASEQSQEKKDTLQFHSFLLGLQSPALVTRQCAQLFRGFIA